MTDLIAAFRPKWAQLIAQVGGDPSSADKVYARLVAAYTDASRHYHDFSHVVWMLNLLDEMALVLENRAAVQLAIWFHDAVYEVGSEVDNELASADFSAEQLTLLGLPTDLIATVHALILDTKHATEPASWDGRVLVDIDLSQLGGSAEQFQRDTANIRKEYAIVPDAQFWSGRQKVLQQFLNRDKIYHTAPLFTRFEAIARHNLSTSIKQIDSRIG
ncbi:MAG: hypothetical protein ACPG8W_09290 [Candidatus Promineifilaceae bacterium]